MKINNKPIEKEDLFCRCYYCNTEEYKHLCRKYEENYAVSVLRIRAALEWYTRYIAKPQLFAMVYPDLFEKWSELSEEHMDLSAAESHSKYCDWLLKKAFEGILD